MPRQYLSPMGLVDKAAYIHYLRGAAQRWREAPYKDAEDHAGNLGQARQVEDKAKRLEAEGQDWNCACGAHGLEAAGAPELTKCPTCHKPLP